MTSITDKLTGLGGLNGVPKDPNLSNTVTGLGNTTGDAGEYMYLVMQKNKINNNGFVLMARVETEGGANWVYSGNVGKI
ncbi:MAG: hypothetical protein LBG59_08700 [Candidatus Peribacteria bacterium]|nr:hypothetical protein [Candidatus Peribacteria bacterium]